MSDVIETIGLVKTYGTRRGLAGLDLQVRSGEVFGFLGPNGAGKSTTIRILLDLIRPTAGRAHVFGRDPREVGAVLRRRVGYLPGEFVVDSGQSSRELLTHLGNLRGGVPNTRIVDLADRLDVDLGITIRKLSKGNRQKVGLIQAFMHEPELLVLDEPTSGLDPFVQQTFLALVMEARARGQTVFMSSHVMSEVEQAADRVGIIRDGRMVTVEQVAVLRNLAIRDVEIRFDVPVGPDVLRGVEGVKDVAIDGPVVRCHLAGRADPLVKRLARHPVASLVVTEPSLEELFFTHYGTDGVRHAA